MLGKIIIKYTHTKILFSKMFPSGKKFCHTEFSKPLHTHSEIGSSSVKPGAEKSPRGVCLFISTMFIQEDKQN